MDLIGIGEILIDFTPTVTEEGRYFKQNAGGAPCNMLTMAQILGTETAFIGKAGNDQFGHYLKQTLEEHGVGTQGFVLSDDYPTTLAFVHLEPSGERDFSFYRKGCADIMLTEDEVDFDLIAGARALHFGSLSFTHEPSRSTVLKAVRLAREKGLLVTYDPNYRPPLWPSEAAAVEGMGMGLELADVVKVSEEEALLLTGESDLEKAGEALRRRGIQLVCITLGEQGSFFSHRAGSGTVPGFKTRVADTTGAGDAFFGSLVHQLLACGKTLAELTVPELTVFLRFANGVASLCIEGLGGIPSLPDRDRVQGRLDSAR